MEWLAAAGGGAFVLVSLVLGVRLLWMAWHTRGLPELAMGLGLFLLGGVGYPILEVVKQARALPVDARVSLLAVQMACHAIGTTAFAFFVAHVFRPGSRIPIALTGLVLAATGGLVVLQLVGPGLAAFVRAGEGPWRIHGAVSLAPLVWGGLESARYFHMMRRRLALGLAEPLIADRFRLWSISLFASGAVAGLSTAVELAGGSLSGSVVGSLVVAAGGGLSAATLWLAFLPPRSYARRVEARSA